MKMTPARQRNAVSEGVALGFVALGVQEIRFDKLRVDLAFESAWRHWAYASRFSQVSTDLRNGLDAYIAMTRTTEGKRTVCFFWDCETGLRINFRQRNFDPHSGEELAWATSMIDGDVSLGGWKALAQAFIDHYESE